MKVLVIPDVHLKPWMFERASEIMVTENIDKAVCLMDIPDDWGKEYQLDLYEETFDAATLFQQSFPSTLWCYGNHDLSYAWLQSESGFSFHAIETVCNRLSELRSLLPDKSQMKYIHRIDKVLFMHGGLSHAFVEQYAAGADYEDTDAVIDIINHLGCSEMWDDASPIWLRPQMYIEKMYGQDELLQVVGHTPVEEIQLDRNIISCDVFSTYPGGETFGTQEFLILNTETWDYISRKA